MANTIHTSSSQDGISVKIYRGDGSALLAFDLDEHRTKDLAGFAVKRTSPDGKSAFLPNRLNFTSQITSDTKPEKRKWTPSNKAPFQKFRWVDFPPETMSGRYKYEVTAMYHNGKGGLKEGPTTEASLELTTGTHGKFEFGFTRGYMSSQAYVGKFKNAEYRKMPKTIKYITKPYLKQYEWLGAHAREMVFRFLDECVKDKGITVDLFAYDLDEPDFIQGLGKLGKRLRAFLDDAPLHTKKGALEIEAKKALIKSAGQKNVKIGHFQRFAHNKVLIQRKDGKPVKVLAGSANFSVRGLYVQANNVLIFDDKDTAKYYGDAFDQAFADESKFRSSRISSEWFDIKGAALPPFSVCFSPHKAASVSLDRVSDAIKKAKSSVLFAVMELNGSGPVMDDLKRLPGERNIFWYGMTQSEKGIKVYKPGDTNGILAGFDYLKSKVPQPFRKEFSGGPGQVIHHKFVVVDFNDTDPVVFTGSSNLAKGGEMQNGDNLLAIRDSAVAAAYAVEAIRLVDHYHFRCSMSSTTKAAPLTLEKNDTEYHVQWWMPYYDAHNIKYRERMLFSR